MDTLLHLKKYKNIYEAIEYLSARLNNKVDLSIIAELWAAHSLNIYCQFQGTAISIDEKSSYERCNGSCLLVNDGQPQELVDCIVSGIPAKKFVFRLLFSDGTMSKQVRPCRGHEFTLEQINLRFLKTDLDEMINDFLATGIVSENANGTNFNYQSRLKEGDRKTKPGTGPMLGGKRSSGIADIVLWINNEFLFHELGRHPTNSEIWEYATKNTRCHQKFGFQYDSPTKTIVWRDTDNNRGTDREAFFAGCNRYRKNAKNLNSDK